MTAVDGTRAGTRRRRSVGSWLAIAAVCVAVGLTVSIISGISQLPASGRLDADAAAPDGSRAVVQILRDHGVEVTVARTLAEAHTALSAGHATLALGDTAPLSDETITALAAAAGDVLLLEPRTRDLRLLLDGASAAGTATGPADPGCDVDAAQRAGSITPGAVYQPSEPGEGAAVTACYPSGDGYGLLVRTDGDRRLAAVDAASLLSNEHLAENGNAALGINLLGRNAQLVWYLPTLDDTEFADAPTIGELTPDWVTPALMMLAIAAIAAGVWRGRRFGPLVAENLPITVRAEETTEGRARLYAHAADRVHAADELRVAALSRLGRRLGLGAGADAREIADAVAALLGADRSAVHGILLDELPTDDRALVDLADRIGELEGRVGRRLHPVAPADPDRSDGPGHTGHRSGSGRSPHPPSPRRSS